MKTPLPESAAELMSQPRWWRVDVPTEIVISDRGLDTVFDLIAARGVNPFFVVDASLRDQPDFARVFEQKDFFAFDASYSEVRTGDVDSLVALLRSRRSSGKLAPVIPEGFQGISATGRFPSRASSQSSSPAASRQG